MKLMEYWWESRHRGECKREDIGQNEGQNGQLTMVECNNEKRTIKQGLKKERTLSWDPPS